MQRKCAFVIAMSYCAEGQYVKTLAKSRLGLRTKTGHYGSDGESESDHGEWTCFVVCLGRQTRHVLAWSADVQWLKRPKNWPKPVCHSNLEKKNNFVHILKKHVFPVKLTAWIIKRLLNHSMTFSLSCKTCKIGTQGSGGWTLKTRTAYNSRPMLHKHDISIFINHNLSGVPVGLLCS